MMNLTNHSTYRGVILTFYDLSGFVKTEGLECALLISRSADSTSSLFDLNCCHNYSSLSVENFIHTDTTLFSYSTCITHHTQREDCCLDEIVRV